MNDSSDSPRPRRRWGVLLLGLAASSIWLGNPPGDQLLADGREPVLAVLAALLLAAYAAFTPASLSYALMLDLRLRERQYLESSGPGGRLWAGLLRKARSVDLVLPYLGGVLLMVAGLSLLEITAGHSAGLELAAVSVAILAVVPLVDLLPMCFAVRAPDRAARWSTSLLEGAVLLLGPPLRAVAWLVDRLLHQGGMDDVEERGPEADLADVIEVGSHQGDLSVAQSELLRRELDFARKVAADVMVPRVEIDYLDLAMSVAEARRFVASSRFSRFPVKHDSVDRVVAVLHVKALLRHAGERQPETIRQLLTLERPPRPLFVEHDQSLDSVLEALKRAKSSLAVVRDAYGGVAGIVTVEDVVEELVGEIVDESDAEVVTERLVISGRRELGELAEHGVELPGEADEIVGDVVAVALDGQVEPGATVTLGGWRLTVDNLDADGAVESLEAERVWSTPERRRS